MPTMRAQMFLEPFRMDLVEIEPPSICDTEVLVRVKAVGICGSDLAYYAGKSPLDTESGKGPLILGHEISGEVADIGRTASEMSGLRPGDRVVVNPAHSCGACRYCLTGSVNLCERLQNVGVSVNGGFADFVKARYTNVYRIPDGISFEQAAMVEPLACATYGVSNLDVQTRDTVVVIGPGPIGLMMQQLIKAKGAAQVVLVGILDYPLSVGKALGADVVLNSANAQSPYYAPDLVERIASLTDGRLADKVIVPTGSVSAMQQALALSGKKSTVVFFGLPGKDDHVSVPVLSSLQMDKTIRFSWLAPLTWPSAIESIRTGQVDVGRLITHRYALDELQEGLRFMASKAERKIKGVVLL